MAWFEAAAAKAKAAAAEAAAAGSKFKDDLKDHAANLKENAGGITQEIKQAMAQPAGTEEARPAAGPNERLEAAEARAAALEEKLAKVPHVFARTKYLLAYFC